MTLKGLSIVALISTALFSQIANAGFVSDRLTEGNNELIYLDTDTEIEYLNTRHTFGMSAEEAIAKYSQYGFQLASSEHMAAVLKNWLPNQFNSALDGTTNASKSYYGRWNVTNPHTPNSFFNAWHRTDTGSRSGVRKSNTTITFNSNIDGYLGTFNIYEKQALYDIHNSLNFTFSPNSQTLVGTSTGNRSALLVRGDALNVSAPAIFSASGLLLYWLAFRKKPIKR